MRHQVQTNKLYGFMLFGIQSKIRGSVTVEVFKGIGLHPK